MKNVTVVGADGFIGSAVVKELCLNGYSPITVTRNSKIDKDINNINIVFYLAGSCTPHNAADNAVHSRFDLKSLMQFLDNLKGVKTRPLFVFASSAGTVYDPAGPQPYRESSWLKAVNHYGQSKLEQENVVREASWVEPLILRLSNIYGPYQKAKPGFGVIAHWAQKISRYEPIEMMGNSGRDYLNIADLVDIFLKIAHNSPTRYTGLTVNIASGETITLEELYHVFTKATVRPIEMIKKPARAFDVKYVSIDNSLAKELFNWQPEITLIAGIKAVLTANYAANNKNIET
ncbi:UDP-glucose 4-epimerase [Erwinia toletana]|uniref:UDP-glucose 4-epimerase n=1 Tax=Winslowiella toletana TaxID=92490 RepID=A0ABS4P449_9GAMM|nr:NAD-dependent epimerase/dehydratase family protein [Winslowiella toletana]MBP2167394.1 UDP-glucose 4-epimerase [Winslowiella toletana]